MSEYESMLKEINDRLEALGQRAAPETIERLVKDKITETLSQDAEFVRKMRFAGGDDESLKGSKWGRLGLRAEDLIFAHDWLLASSRKPSEALANFYRTRAMDTQESGFGQQLVGVAYNTTLWDAALAQTRVFGLIPSFQMKAPTEYLPVAAQLPEVMLLAESTASNQSNYATTPTGSNRVTVTAKKLGFHEMWSGEMEEDSIIPYIPFLRARAEAAIAFYNDSLIVNGDETTGATGNINRVDGAPPAGSFYLAFDGLRHVGLVDNTGNGRDANGAISLTLLSGVRGLMLQRAFNLDWGHPQNANDLVYLADPQTADSICELAGVVTWFQQQAEPLLTGQVARALGHPVISTIAIKLTLPSGMVNAADNGTKGQVVVFNRNGFTVGWMRGVKMEFERLPATDQSRMVYTWRIGFGRYTPNGNVNAIEAAAVIYNITV